MVDGISSECSVWLMCWMSSIFSFTHRSVVLVAVCRIKLKPLYYCSALMADRVSIITAVQLAKQEFLCHSVVPCFFIMWQRGTSLSVCHVSSAARCMRHSSAAIYLWIPITNPNSGTSMATLHAFYLRVLVCFLAHEPGTAWLREMMLYHDVTIADCSQSVCTLIRLYLGKVPA